MQVIDKKSVADKVVMQDLSELHKVRETIRIYREKYGQSLSHFKEQMAEQPDDFEHFDDYIDWKAAVKQKELLEQRMEDLKHGDFEVT